MASTSMRFGEILFSVGAIMKWRTFFTIVGVICCLFLALPIKIKKEHSLTEQLFKKFVHAHNKSYVNNETEYQIRYQLFQDSLKIIEELNADRQEGSAMYGVTVFSDLSPEEFKHRHLRSAHHKHFRKAPYRGRRAALQPFPEKKDWRSLGVVTGVRDQRLCGACWAFSTVETIETMNALKNRTLQNLSVQQLIDCAGNGNNGCSGGDSRLLLEWLTSNKVAIEPEKQYPYVESDNFCKYKPAGDGVQVKSFSCKNMIGGEDAILDELANHGPVTVAVNAMNWQFYLGGVIQYHCPGSLADLNHAVQLVGYENSGFPPYYIARNSWGTEFGNKGYLYLGIAKNICGVANEVCSLDVV